MLAGTMLMGSGVSGNRPDAHDSSVTLATLVQQIAVYRDAFYEKLLAGLSGPHAERLRAEAVALRQPLGGARQHFNQHLARRRAAQLQHVHLALLFARHGLHRGGGPAGPRRAGGLGADEVRHLLPAYHRPTWRIEARRAGGRRPPLLDEVEDLLHRAIECGALVDPWNILGFGGQFSLFPAAGKQRLRSPRRRTDRPDGRDFRGLRGDPEGGRRRRQRPPGKRHVAAA